MISDVVREAKRNARGARAGRAGSPFARWTPAGSWTKTPASATRITIPNARLAYVRAGQPIRMLFGGSTYIYALISAVNSGSIDIYGPTLTGATITGLWFGNSEMVAPIDLQVGGLYAVTAQTILGNLGRTFLEWQFGPAALVTFKAWSKTLGAGTAKVNVQIAGTSVDTNGVVCSTSGVRSGAIDRALYSIVRGQALEIVVSATDATAADLTLSSAFVLA